MKSVKLVQEIPIIGHYDVVVCGGGPAGFMAALGAARTGSKVALIERYGFLGGMGTAGLVEPLSEFYVNGTRAIGGLPWEFANRLIDAGGGIMELPLGNVSFNPEVYKLVAQRMIREANVDLYFHSYLSNCICNDNRISHVIIANKNGSEAISGNYFIDCTGDADLASMSDVPMQELCLDENNLQPATMVFTLGGVDTSNMTIHFKEEGIPLDNQAARKTLLALRENIKVPKFGGPWFCSMVQPGMVAVNMTRAAVNAVDNRSLSRAEEQLREDVFSLVALLKENCPAFYSCFIISTATQIGIRETRRIKGVHTLTGEEYVSGIHFDDTVACGAHHIDIHDPNNDKQHVEFLKQAGCIPYRCLIAEGYPNLLVAGRSISVDKTAFSSIRVQLSAMGIGQAAGVAAALCNKQERPVTNADISWVRQVLAKMGAVI